MKPDSKRTASSRRRSNNDVDGYSPFNLRTLKHAIDAIDTVEEKTINLSSLSVALSAVTREMKQPEKSQRKRFRKKRKKRNKRKLMIGLLPETHAELERWFSHLDESLKRSSMKESNMTDKVAPKTLTEPLICGFNTDFTMHHFSDALDELFY